MLIVSFFLSLHCTLQLLVGMTTQVELRNVPCTNIWWSFGTLRLNREVHFLGVNHFHSDYSDFSNIYNPDLLWLWLHIYSLLFRIITVVVWDDDDLKVHRVHNLLRAVLLFFQMVIVSSICTSPDVVAQELLSERLVSLEVWSRLDNNIIVSEVWLFSRARFKIQLRYFFEPLQ